jgi:hypothetical protein
VCRPGRTLVGGVAQTVGAAVGAAHALCLGGVEVALADHPGGLVAGELQRGGGGRELHQQGGSRALEEHDRIVLAQVWPVFPCRHGMRGAASPLRSTARRAAAAPSISGRLHWRRAHACFGRAASVPRTAIGAGVAPAFRGKAAAPRRYRVPCEGHGTLLQLGGGRVVGSGPPCSRRVPQQSIRT